LYSFTEAREPPIRKLGSKPFLLTLQSKGSRDSVFTMNADVDRNIHAWAMSEIMPWRMRCLADDVVPGAAVRLSAIRNMFKFTIQDGDVSVEPKSNQLAEVGADRRCRTYLGFFQEVLRAYPSIPDTMFVLSVGDMAPPGLDTPFFQFQKPAGSSSILLPDIESIELEYYHQPALTDNIPYATKAPSAIFVGGTSGQLNTVETVRNPVAQRLRAAKYFRGHSDVHFLLTSLAQCENTEAEQALRDLGFGGPRIPWPEQFLHKFIISVDGNGATCSRVVIALKSNSVLLKYDSPHHLYYFRGLLPWRHYIPISVDSDIEDIILIERECPNTFASIAEGGRCFAEAYLTRPRVLQYAAEVLTGYARYVHPATG
jgi:hypothetical protein